MFSNPKFIYDFENCGILPESTAGISNLDFYSIPAKLDVSSIIMGHTAGSYHGLTLQVSTRAICYSMTYRGLLNLDGMSVYFIPYPRSMIGKDLIEIGAIHNGFWITSIEKTLIDMFQLPEFSGGSDEVLESFSTALLLGIDFQLLYKYAVAWNDLTLIKRLFCLFDYFKSKWGVYQENINLFDVSGDFRSSQLFWGESGQWNDTYKIWFPDKFLLNFDTEGGLCDEH